MQESKGAFLIEAQYGSHAYLIVPDKHTEELTGLPDSWWQDVKQLLASVPELAGDYNLSLNYGKQAGQSLKHLHFWIIPRPAGMPASGKGFARLINEANERSE